MTTPKIYRAILICGEIGYRDSINRPIEVGSRVRFRGANYTIKAFRNSMGRGGCAAIEFNEPMHTDEIPDEWAVDLLDLQ